MLSLLSATCGCQKCPCRVSPGPRGICTNVSRIWRSLFTVWPMASSWPEVDLRSSPHSPVQKIHLRLHFGSILYIHSIPCTTGQSRKKINLYNSQESHWVLVFWLARWYWPFFAFVARFFSISQLIRSIIRRFRGFCVYSPMSAVKRFWVSVIIDPRADLRDDSANSWISRQNPWINANFCIELKFKS